MITTLDVETTYQEGDPSPYNDSNKLVSVGINKEYYFFNHKDNPNGHDNFDKIQKILDESTLVIGHNLKFDLSWMYWEGWKYNGDIYDTMLGEYIIRRGQKVDEHNKLISLSLKESCKRRGLGVKSDIFKAYTDDGFGIDEIPMEKLEEYGRVDVDITYKLYQSQIQDYQRPHNKKLIPTRNMSNQFLRVIIEMEMNGNCINVDNLSDIEKHLTEEHYKLKTDISKTIEDVMGDTKINISSGEDLSKVIYSRKVQDKDIWGKLFNIGIDKYSGRAKKKPYMTDPQFRGIIDKYTDSVYKTIANDCPKCQGVGLVRLIKVDGTPYKSMNKCKNCSGQGKLYVETDAVAGFKYKPYSYKDTCDGGFKTDKFTLDRISTFGRGKIKEFVDSLMKFSANEKLLNTFVTALKDNVRPSGILHPSFHQVRTATGRLSSSDPNFQNLPRDGGIKKVIVSRFKDGKIFEVDFAQLEFRTAVFLAQDKQGMEDIQNGVDVHQFTADVIGCTRQEAKAHTFKPLYGGIMGNENEKRYYKKFLEKYKDIASWHKNLEEKAIKYKLISIPSGREYHFPNAYRTKWGSCSHSTTVKNYPVQGFATADIVPIACINIWSLMKEKNVKSLIINTVHDSVVVDVYPGEEDIIESIIKTGCSRVKDSLLQLYDCDFNVPLDIEIKKGSNWLDLNVA